MEGVTFRTSEHCYQWYAAKEALQDEVAEAVARAESPGQAKRLAAKIKSFIPNWNEVKYDVMKAVQEAKAESSYLFREQLLESGDKMLCEGLPDPYWGSGLNIENTITTKPEFWPGQNNLGKILMDLRSRLRNDVEAEEMIVAEQNYAAAAAAKAPPTRESRTRNSGQRSTPKVTSSSKLLVNIPVPAKKCAHTPLFSDFVFKKHTLKRLGASPISSARKNASSTQLDAAAQEDAKSFVSFEAFIGGSQARVNADFGSDSEVDDNRPR